MNRDWEFYRSGWSELHDQSDMEERQREARAGGDGARRQTKDRTVSFWSLDKTVGLGSPDRLLCSSVEV